MPANRLIGLSLAAGLLSALLFLSLVKGIALGVVLSYVAPLPLMMAGLGLGMGASVIAGVVGAAAVALVAGAHAFLPFLVAAALPSLVVSSRALLCREAEGTTEWYPPGLVLAWLTATGLALMLLGTALVSGHPDGVRAWVADAISRTLEMLASEIPPNQREQAVGWWTPLFPSMIVGSWLVMAVLNATGAQGLLVRFGRNRRPSPAYRDLFLPDWLALVLVAAGTVAALSGGDAGYVSANAAVVALVPFFFLGLAGIHRFAAGRPNARPALAVTYGVLVLAFGWAALLVAGLGLVRFWTMRFRRPDSGGGMEG